MDRHRLLAPALLLLTALLWSLGGVLIKSVEWNPMAIAGVRSAIAVPLVLLCLGRPRWPFSPAQIGGAIAYAATVILFVAATRMTTAANAIFLQYTAPIYVACCSGWLLGEPARRRDWVIISIALAGIGLFFLDHLTFAGLWGNVLALGSGAAFAGVALFLRREKSGSPMVVILLGNVLAALIGLPFAFTSPPLSGSWLPLLLMGILQLGLPYVLYATAIKHVKALEATLITFLEPVLNPLWVMLVVGERPGAWAFAGGALVLGAVAVRGVLMVREKDGDGGLGIGKPGS
ncbi:MAG: DMT family transporter [Verrucomicrobiota bacterium]|nr:DMT family transporter [Verrucomicrobiota bacterium]